MAKKLDKKEILKKEILYPSDKGYETLAGIKAMMFAPPHQKCPHCDAIVVAKARIGVQSRMGKHKREKHYTKEGKCPNCAREIPDKMFKSPKEIYEEKLGKEKWINRCPYCGWKVFENRVNENV